MKKVGVISRNQKIDNHDYVTYNKKVVDVIIEHNCIPVGIIVDKKMKSVKKIVDLCDGIILQGGNYINEIDKEIVNYLYKKDIPTLGICLGMQIMSLGDIKKAENHNSNLKYVHKIKINNKSKLYEIIKNNEICVNSRHNDYVYDTIYDVGAYSEDNIIEEIEDKNKKFYMGLQWHPESIKNDKNSKLIFKEFFRIVKEH